MINPRNVLLIINSDISQSAADANWYATSRGLRWAGGGYHQLHFNFGAANSVSVADLDTKITCRNVGPHLNKGCTRAIADYVKNNDIDAIILSTHLPARVTGLPTGDNNAGGNTGSLAPFLGVAGDHIYPTLLAVGSRTTSPAGYTAQRSKGTGYDSSASSKVSGLFGPQFSQHKISGLSRPWGRIGMPRPDTSTANLNTAIAEGPAPANSQLNLMQRCVLDALWGEQQNHASALHLVGGTTATEEADVPTLLGDFAATRGINYKSWGSGGQGWATGGAGTQFFQSGTLNPRLEPFGMVFAAALSYDGFQSTARTTSSNWKPLRGGWTFHWAAGGRAVGQDSIVLGGCSAIFSYWDPETNGLPRTFDVLYGLVDGRLSMAEAVFFSRNLGFARCEVVGDPLYVPYKNTSFAVPVVSGVNVSSATLPTAVEPAANPTIDTTPTPPAPIPPAVNIPASFDIFRGNTINLAPYFTLAAGATLVSVTVTAGTLPAGVSIASSTGVITVGAAATLGVASGLRVTVTDSNAQSTQSGAFSINVQQVIINPPPDGFDWIPNAPTEISIGVNEVFDLKTLFKGSTTGTTRAVIVDESPLSTISVTEANDGVLTGGATMPAGFVDVQVYATDQPLVNYTEAFEPNNYTDDDFMPHDGPLSGVSAKGWAGRLSMNQDWQLDGTPGVLSPIPYYDTNTTQGGLTPPHAGGKWSTVTYTAPNASTGMQVGDKINIDVTQLVKGWVGKNFSNAGFWVKQVGGSSRQSFASRQYAEVAGIPKKVSQGGTPVPAYYPVLTITGAYNKTIQCSADSTIGPIGGGGIPVGDDPTVVPYGSNAGAIMYFSVLDIPNAAAVTTATLTLTACRQYRPSDTTVFIGTGSFTLDVYRARHPFRKEPEFTMPSMQTGIAWNYARDKGLETHPDSIFVERFDGKIYNSSGVQSGTTPNFRTDKWLDFRVSNDLGLAQNYVASKPNAGSGDVIIGADTQHPGHEMQPWYPNMVSLRALWEGFNDGRFADDRVDRDWQNTTPIKNWVYVWKNNATPTLNGTTITTPFGIPATTNHTGVGAAVWQPVYVEPGDAGSMPAPLVTRNSGANWYYANNISDRVLSTDGTREITPRGKTFTLHATIGGPAITFTSKTVFTLFAVGDCKVDQPNVITLPRGLPHSPYFPNTLTGSNVFKPVWVEGVLTGITPRAPNMGVGSYFLNNISPDGKSATLHAEPFGPALTFPVQAGPITISGFRERGTTPWAATPKLTGGGLATAPWTTDINLSTWEEMNWRMLYLLPTDWSSDVDAMKNFAAGFDGRWSDKMGTSGMGVGNSGGLADGMAGWSIRGHTEFCGNPDYAQDTPFFRTHSAFGTYTYCNTLWAHEGAFDIFPWPGTVTVGNPGGTYGGGKSGFGSGMSFNDFGLGLAEFGRWYCYEARCKINTVRPNDEPVYIGDGVVNTYNDGTGSVCPPGYACYDARHANPAFGGAGAGVYPDTMRSRYKLPATWASGKASYSEAFNSILDPSGKQFWTNASARFNTELSKTDMAFRRAMIERMPTRGNYDGEYEIWVNGRQVQLRVGLMMRHVEWLKNRVNGQLVPFAINYPFFTAQVGGNNRCFRTTYSYAAHLAITGTPYGSVAAHPRAVYIGPPRNVETLP